MASGFSREFWRKIKIFNKVNVFTKNILRQLKGVLLERWATTLTQRATFVFFVASVAVNADEKHREAQEQEKEVDAVMQPNQIIILGLCAAPHADRAHDPHEYNAMQTSVFGSMM